MPVGSGFRVAPLYVMYPIWDFGRIAEVKTKILTTEVTEDTEEFNQFLSLCPL
jgi:hypothetical protein